MSDIDDLHKLADLKDKGTITQQEFQRKNQKYLLDLESGLKQLGLKNQTARDYGGKYPSASLWS